MKKLVMVLVGVLWAGAVGAECRVVGVVEGVEEGVVYVRRDALGEFYYEVKVGEELERVVKEIRGAVQVVFVTDDLVCPGTDVQILGNAVSVELN